jgi:beta-lactam-binding protein with PASTA domain
MTGPQLLLRSVRVVPPVLGLVAGGLTGRAYGPAVGWPTGLLAAVAASIAALLFAGRLRTATTREPAVPRVVGLPLADAKALLTGAGFSVASRDGDVYPDAPLDVVVTQRPRPGEMLPRGATVALTTSRRSR